MSSTMGGTPIEEMVCFYPEHIPVKIYHNPLDLFPKQERFKLVWHVEHWMADDHEYGYNWDKFHKQFEEWEHDKAVAKFNELIDKHPKAKIQFLGFNK